MNSIRRKQNKQEREAIKRILDRIKRWKAGFAGEYMQKLAFEIDYHLIDDNFRELGGVVK